MAQDTVSTTSVFEQAAYACLGDARGVWVRALPVEHVERSKFSRGALAQWKGKSIEYVAHLARDRNVWLKTGVGRCVKITNESEQ